MIATPASSLMGNHEQVDVGFVMNKLRHIQVWIGPISGMARMWVIW